MQYGVRIMKDAEMGPGQTLYMSTSTGVSKFKPGFSFSGASGGGELTIAYHGK
jgi:hypothetical protein